MALNMVSLTIGLVCAILILIVVYDQFTFDRSHVKFPRIFRLESDIFISGKRDFVAVSSLILGPVMKREMDGIEEVVRVLHDSRLLLARGDRMFYEDGFIYADPGFFKIFTHSFLPGSLAEPLAGEHSVVLTESLARKYFGDGNPIGQRVKLDADQDLVVTGVIRDLPANLHLKFTGVITLKTLEKEWGRAPFDEKRKDLFWSMSCYTYLLLKEGVSIEKVLAGWPAFYARHMAEGGKLVNGRMTLRAMNLADLHFLSQTEFDLPRGNMGYVYIFIWAGVFMLLLACINYMNLATARASLRSREIGVRKVVGGGRRNIMAQFLGESVVLAILSLVFSLSLVEMLLPALNRFTGDVYHFQTVFAWPVFPVILAITMVIGLLSGIYPAFYLASFQPVETLKRKGYMAGKSGLLRKTLVVFQFTVSIVMVSMNLVATRQVKFLKNKDMGFDREKTLVLFIQDSLVRNRLPELRREFLANPGFQSVCVSSMVPGITPTKTIMMADQGGEMRQMVLSLISADSSFLQAYQLTLLQGRNFSAVDGVAGEDAFILNESAVKKLGWEPNPVGRELVAGVKREDPSARKGRVVGVIADFNFRSLQYPCEPMAIMAARKTPGMVSLKYRFEDSAQAIREADRIYRRYDTRLPMDYFILDDYIKEQYSDEANLAELFSYTAVLSILIALLGLLGLSSFLASRRRTEIGIRKVMGAGLFEIMVLLNREFILLVGISILFSIPLAWYFSLKWLSGFAYHFPLDVWPFVISGTFSLLIALLSINIHNLKAANQSPVESLKCVG